MKSMWLSDKYWRGLESYPNHSGGGGGKPMIRVGFLSPPTCFLPCGCLVGLPKCPVALESQSAWVLIQAPSSLCDFWVSESTSHLLGEPSPSPL